MSTYPYLPLALLLVACGPDSASSDAATEVGTGTDAATTGPGTTGADPDPTSTTTPTTGPTSTTEPTDGEPAGCERLAGNGEVEWYLRCGGGAYEDVVGVSVDATGNIYVVLDLRGEGGAPVVFGTFEITPGEGSDIVIVKLDAAGAVLWVKHFTGPGHQYPVSMAGCGDGVVISGSAPVGTLDFGGGPLADENFVASLDGEGAARWSRSLPILVEDGHVNFLEMACDADENLAVVGAYRGSVDLGNGPITPVVPEVIYDGLVARYDAVGTLLWARGFGNSDGDYPYGRGIAYAPDGAVVLIGSFDGTIDLGGGPLTADSGDDVVVARLDAAGEHVWSRQVGPEGLQYGDSVAVDAAGKVAIGGIFLEGITLGADSYTNTFPDAVEDIDGTLYDGFLAFLDAMGAPQSSLQIGSKLDDAVFGLRFATDGALVLSGYTSEAYLLRAHIDGAPAWTWTTDQLAWADIALDGTAVVLATSASEAVDLGAGPLAPRGATDLIVAKIRRGQ